MRRRLRISIIALVVLLLGGVIGLVGRDLWRQSTRKAASSGWEFLPGVSQHIRDFRRVKVQDGRTVWEVSAREARYFEEDKLVVVRAAVVELYLADGRKVGLKGDEGRIQLDDREVRRVELEGNIEVSLADYTVRTDRAVYDLARQIVSAPGAVEITSAALQLRGDGMEAEVQRHRLTLLRQVWMELQPALLKRDGTDAPF